MTYGIIFADGFDHYANQAQMARKWSNSGGFSGVATGRFGRGQAIKIGTNAWLKGIPNRTTLVCGFAYQCNGLSGSDLFIFRDSVANSEQCKLYLPGDGTISVRSSSTLGITGAIIGVGVWNYIEFKVVLGTGTSGYYILKVNGDIVLQNAACTTQKTANAWINQISLATPGGGDCVDDLVLSTGGNFIGEVEIRTQYPTSDNSVQFTRNTGATNYSAVDDPATQDDDTTYVEDANVGDIDLYGLTAMSPAPTSVLAVAVNNCMKKSDSGPRSGNNHISSNGTVAEGTVLALPTSYVVQQDIWEIDPHTSAAWTIANANALLIGTKVAA